MVKGETTSGTYMGTRVLQNQGECLWRGGFIAFASLLDFMEKLSKVLSTFTFHP